MAYLVAGPFVALVGIVAVFFVLRRKSVEKRSMYSARRSQIEHKVRAARQRTLTPRGRSKPTEATVAAAPMETFAQPQQTMTWATPASQAPAYEAPAYQAPAYEAPAYEAPPSAPPSAPPPPPAYEPPSAPAPWDAPPAAPGAPSSFDYPPASPEPAYAAAPAETFRPAPEPTPMAPSEPAWTPAPEPSAPAEQIDQPMAEPVGAASSSSAGGWSVVTSEKDSSVSEAASKSRDGSGATGSWQLASGEAPNLDEGDEPKSKRPTKTAMAVAQYAVLVVGLVMVLIGVLVMVANSKVT